MGLVGAPIDLRTGLFVNYHENTEGNTRAYFINLDDFGLYHTTHKEDYREIESVFADDESEVMLDPDALMVFYFELKLFKYFSDELVTHNTVRDIENYLGDICFYFNSRPDTVKENFDYILSLLKCWGAHYDKDDWDRYEFLTKIAAVIISSL